MWNRVDICGTELIYVEELMDRGFTYSPGQASISRGQNLIFVYAEKGNIVLRYEDHTPASHLFHPVHLPTHIRQFLSAFVTCYIQYACAATNDTYPRKGMSGLTSRNNSVLLFDFSNNASRTGIGKYIPEENRCFDCQTIKHRDLNTDTGIL